jgi:hypothetical protein
MESGIDHLGLFQKAAIVIFTKGIAVIARDLERLLTAQGVGGAKMDAITRKLRESGRLPKGGRGPHAPTIGPNEAATILIAVAGSAKGNEADARVGKLESLRSTSGDHAKRTLLEVLALLLKEPSELQDVAEVRVARTQRRAAVHFVDGRVEEFRAPKPENRTDRFHVEGILPSQLLRLIALAIHENDQNASNASGEHE